MITMHASAVCRVRDGYTGQPLEGSALVCTLDGAPVRPLSKPGGLLVLLDLPPGPHRLALRSHGYQEEWVDFQADGGTQELEAAMKPGEGYPFREEVTRLALTLTEGGGPAAGMQLWLAAPARWDLKIAQTKAEAGSDQFRIYCKGSPDEVPPGPYLIADGEDSEIVLLRELAEEMGTVARPLSRTHSRSRSLLPAQCYHTGPDGSLSAVFRSACKLELYSETKGLIASLTLEPGENKKTISL